MMVEYDFSNNEKSRIKIAPFLGGVGWRNRLCLPIPRQYSDNYGSP
jgi:hypothetical protein